MTDPTWTLVAISPRDGILEARRVTEHWVVPIAYYANNGERTRAELVLWVHDTRPEILIAPGFAVGGVSEVSQRPYTLRVAQRRRDDIWRMAIAHSLHLQESTHQAAQAWRRNTALGGGGRGFWEMTGSDPCRR
jgi:hypothetical protein